MRVTSRKQARRNRGGAAMVEFAVVLPLFVMSLLGIIEMGRAFMAYEMVANSAREGAREAVLPHRTSTAPVETRVKSALETGTISSTKATVTVKVNGTKDALSSASRGDEVTVSVSVPFSSVSFLTPVYLSNVDLTSEVTMRRE